MTKPVLGAQVYTIRHFIKTEPDFAQSMAKLRAIGYTAVQLDLEHHPDLPAVAIKRMCDEAGLAICISHFDYDLFLQEVDAIIERQKIWACSNTAIVAMPERYHALGADGYRRFAAEATAIGEKLAAAGITLSYHNHSFEFVRFGQQTGLDIILTESDPSYLKAEIDTYWVQHGGGDPAAWIAQVKDRMPVVHLKDMAILPDNSQVFAEIGEGNLNWTAILSASEASGVQWAVVEQDVCRRDPFESLRMSYTYLAALGLA